MPRFLFLKIQSKGSRGSWTKCSGHSSLTKEEKPVQETVPKWPAELGPVLRAGIFRLSSQFILQHRKRKTSWLMDLWPLAGVPRWHSRGIAPFMALSQRHAISSSFWSLLFLNFFLNPVAAQLLPLPWSKNVSKLGLQWLGEGRRPRKPELSLWKFSTKVSNSLNSNQAWAAPSPYELFIKGPKRGNLSPEQSLLRSFQVIPFGKETISYVCTRSGKLPAWLSVQVVALLASFFFFKSLSMEVSAVPYSCMPAHTHRHTCSVYASVLGLCKEQMLHLGWLNWV